MKLTVKAVRSSEAAHILRRALGPVRAWEKALDEMRRDEEAHYLGLRIEPYGRQRDQTGCARPVYLLDNVLEFVRQAREAALHPTNPGHVQIFEVEIDTAIVCPWRFITLKTKRPHAVH
ncbi:hypothetical protein AWB74_01732 [Caballeronia arvi]|uniref:Uncharacterized protein n=1 Tax=Caballeronia arvi TaxID=1777135 RepID=A0A158HEQ4_9BURK|nr:hypothetical protein [Caballeronia arvi]SAL42513.1 hypothetical protein AWB74_01732 [Caballeronia arvi]